MLSPVRCTHCGTIYSLGQIKPGDYIARYADCDVFRTPCCGRQVDTRSWKSLPDYTRVERGELRRTQHGYKDDMGRFVKVHR